MLKRLALNTLIEWAQSGCSKPMLLQGARQSGKTWLMQELGKNCFKNTAYFDFAENPSLLSIFEGDLNPDRIIRELQALSSETIEKKNTLIIFDEIQRSDRAFASLKYFEQSQSQYRIIAAGSLLGVALRKRQVFAPVGKVEILQISPLSFSEYLLNSAPMLYDYIQSYDSLLPISEAIYEKLQDQFRYFCICGGMPEAAQIQIESGNIAQAEKSLNYILALYLADFSQYTTPAEAIRIADVWNAIPSQLARPQSRFFLSQINKNARSREYRPAIQWLEDAGLIKRVYQISKPAIPLKAYENPDFFKVFVSDIGLLRVMAKIPAKAITQNESSYQEFKGSFTENFIALSLSSQLGFSPSYWENKGKGEVDFVIQHNDGIFPVEVKSGQSIRANSLQKYTKTFDPKLVVRFSQKNLKLDGRTLNIPLCLADWSTKWIHLAANTLGKNT